MKRFKISTYNMLAILFCLVIFFFLGTIAERVFRYSVLGQNPDLIAAETEEGASSDSNKEDLILKQFPFKDKDGSIKDEKTDSETTIAKNEKSVFNVFSDSIKLLNNNIPFYTEKQLFLRMQFINLNAHYNKLIGMKILENSNSVVVSMLDGNLIVEPWEQDISASANSVVDFYQHLKEIGTEFLFVQVPSKVDPDNNLLPHGLIDYENIEADEMINILKTNDTPYLDLRQSMREQNISYTDAFFKTDHHWTIDTAFWASGEIADYINSRTSIKIDTSKFNIDNYSKKVYKNISLGSLGKMVSEAYVDPEDFTVILPKFETSFEFYDFSDQSYRGGNFEKALVNLDILQKKDYYNVSTYSSYMYTWSSLVSIENKMAENDTSILVFGDSFRNSVVPFLSTGVKNVYSMGTGFTGSVYTFLEKYNPDFVIILVYPPRLSSFENGIK